MLLRKLYLDKEEHLKRLDRDSADEIKAGALSLFKHEQLGLIKRGCELLVKVEVYMMRELALIEFVEQSFAAAATTQKIGLLYLLEISCEYAYEEKALLQKSRALEAIFALALDDSSVAVRTAGLVGLTAFLVNIVDEEAILSFRGVLPVVLGKSVECLKADEEAGRKALHSLTDLVESKPRFVRGITQELVVLFTEIMDSPLSDPLRIEAMAGLLALAESNPAALRKSEEFRTRTCPAYMRLLTEIEGISLEEWTEQLTEDAASNLSVALAAKENLAHLAGELGVKHLLQWFSPLIQQGLGSGSAKQEHAALVTLAMLSQGLSKVAPLNSLMPVLLAIRGQMPILEEDLIMCFALFSEEYSPEMQQRYAPQMCAVILAGLQHANPRVRLRAIEMITNYVQGIVDADEEEPVSEPAGGVRDRIREIAELVIRNFSHSLTARQVTIQKECLEAISILADLAGSAFREHYCVLMKDLPVLISDPAAAQEIKERSITCIGHLLSSMKDQPEFAADCPAVVESVIALQQSLAAPDDSTHTAILEFYEKMVQVLAEGFAGYLPRVVPVVLRSLDLDVSVKIVESGKAEQGKKGKFTTATIDMKLFGGVKNIVMNTAALELKIKASGLLLALIEHSGEHFRGFVGSVLPMVARYMSFKNSKEIRQKMAATVTPLARLAGEEKGALLGELLPCLLAELQNVIRLQDDRGICLILEQLHDSLDQPSDQVRTTCQAAAAVVPALLKDIADGHAGKEDDATEQEKMEEEVEEAEEIYEWLVKLSDKWAVDLRKGVPSQWLADFRKSQQD